MDSSAPEFEEAFLLAFDAAFEPLGLLELDVELDVFDPSPSSSSSSADSSGATPTSQPELSILMCLDAAAQPFLALERGPIHQRLIVGIRLQVQDASERICQGEQLLPIETLLDTP